jgi:hypothetical protein
MPRAFFEPVFSGRKAGGDKPMLFFMIQLQDGKEILENIPNSHSLQNCNNS